MDTPSGEASTHQNMWQEALMSSPDFAKWLHLNGEMIEGVSSTDSSTLLSLGSRTSKAICAVYSWIVIDVVEGQGRSNTEPSVSPEHLNRAGDGLTDPQPALLPLMLFAHYVEEDNAGRFDKGVSIRTSYATAYDGRGIFETKDTIYLLLGKGFRRSIPGDVITALPEGVVSEDYSFDRQNRHRGIAALNESSGTVYCDVQMSIAQAQALLELVQALRASGRHGILESVFCDIEREIGTSVRNGSNFPPKN
jgi:hypothetical protein